MPKLRVYQLARELNRDNTEIIRELQHMGVPVTSHSNTVEDRLADRLRKELGVFTGQAGKAATTDEIVEVVEAPAAAHAAARPAAPVRQARTTAIWPHAGTAKTSVQSWIPRPGSGPGSSGRHPSVDAPGCAPNADTSTAGATPSANARPRRPLRTPGRKETRVAIRPATTQAGAGARIPQSDIDGRPHGKRSRRKARRAWKGPSEKADGSRRSGHDQSDARQGNGEGNREGLQCGS